METVGAGFTAEDQAARRAEQERRAVEVDRCTGHCCRSFCVETHSLDELKKLAAEGHPDAILVVDMIEPGDMPGFEGRGTRYRCRHLIEPSGDCSIYATRPQMCKAFPYHPPCTFLGCTRRTVGEIEDVERNAELESEAHRNAGGGWKP